MKRAVDKYQPISLASSHWTAPSVVICSVWLLLLVLGAYFGNDIRYKAEDAPPPYSTLGHSFGLAFQQLSQKSSLEGVKSWTAPHVEGLYESQRRLGSNIPPSMAFYGESAVYEWEQEEDACMEEEDTEGSLPQAVLLIGASSMRMELGLAMKKLLEKRSGLQVHRHAKPGTGLSRPDVYNWPEVTYGLIQEHKADLVIAQFIGNDCQALIQPDGEIHTLLRSPDWGLQYKERVKTFISGIQSQGAEVVMIGMPIVRSERFRDRIIYANGLVRDAAAETGAYFIPTWSLSTTSAGEYREEIRVGKQTHQFRISDGVHFTRAGAWHVAKGLHARLEELYPWQGSGKRTGASL